MAIQKKVLDKVPKTLLFVGICQKLAENQGSFFASCFMQEGAINDYTVGKMPLKYVILT